jgi:hypothetical protein
VLILQVTAGKGWDWARHERNEAPVGRGDLQVASNHRSFDVPQNRLHFVRDTTLREDDSKIRSGALPRTMASLRNLAISTFHQDGDTNIAAALRRTSRDYHRPLEAFGLNCSRSNGE